MLASAARSPRRPPGSSPRASGPVEPGGGVQADEHPFLRELVQALGAAQIPLRSLVA